MCCPFFEPRVRFGEGPWDPAPRLPLGDAWSGVCITDGGEPEESQQREICNSGYARGRCTRFPQGAKADAVRFSPRLAEDGQVVLVWVLEKDHAPVEHGVLGSRAAESLLEQQARAFRESHGLVERALVRSAGSVAPD